MDQELVQYLEERFERQEQRLNARFDRIEQRLDGHDQRFEQIDRRFEGIDRRFDEVNDRIEEVKRHSGVLIEDLRYQVRLVAWGSRPSWKGDMLRTRLVLTNASTKPRRCSAHRSSTSLGKTTSSASAWRTSNRGIRV